MGYGNTALAQQCMVNIRFLWLLTVRVHGQYNHRGSMEESELFFWHVGPKTDTSDHIMSEMDIFCIVLKVVNKHFNCTYSDLKSSSNAMHINPMLLHRFSVAQLTTDFTRESKVKQSWKVDQGMVNYILIN